MPDALFKGFYTLQAARDWLSGMQGVEDLLSEIDMILKHPSGDSAYGPNYWPYATNIQYNPDGFGGMQASERMNGVTNCNSSSKTGRSPSRHAYEKGETHLEPNLSLFEQP